MNKIGTLIASSLIALSTSGKVAKTVVKETAADSAKVITNTKIAANDHLASMGKSDTLVKQNVENICNQVKKFRAGVEPGSPNSMNHLHLLSSNKGVSFFTNPALPVPSYVSLDSSTLKTTFKICPEK